jgi:phage shock protein A
MGSFSRLRYVIAANVNSLLEKAEDPEKLLKALIRDMEDAGEDARLASADLLAEQTHLKRLHERYEREIEEWSARAQKAVETSRDDLARTALRAKAEAEQAQQSAADESRNLDERVTQLEFDMATLKSKLAEAKAKLRDIQAHRSPSANGRPAMARHKLSPGERRMRNAMGRFDRLQAQVDRLEARVKSYEVGGEAVNAWVAEEAKGDPAIEAELAQLKKRIAPQAPAAEAKTDTGAET